jgi:hypothetical protein
MEDNVLLLTDDQAFQLRPDEYTPGIKFSPIKDGKGRWVISKYERDIAFNYKYPWLYKLPEIEWIKPEYTKEER